MTGTPSIVALCGGVGGAKLVLGLDRELEPGALTVIVNTGDDFEHLGLKISPDIDTVLYTLAGLSDPAKGWGRAAETWSFMAEIERLGGETWFQLGDRDLALHVERTRRLRLGESLTDITADLARRLCIGSTILPMTDAAVATRVDTDCGTLTFQDYFVARRAEPALSAVHFQGAAVATAPEAALAALAAPDLRGVVIAPSNPYLSIDPILAIPDLREALARTQAPIVAVSPIVAGAALKGPTAKIMGELGLAVTSDSIARHYGPMLDGLIIDQEDAAEVTRLPLPVEVAPTVMTSLDDKTRLASTALAFIDRLRAEAPRRGAA